MCFLSYAPNSIQISFASHASTPAAFSSEPEILSDPIISCVRIANDFAVARRGCWTCARTRGGGKRKKESRKVPSLFVSRRIERRPVALLLRTHRDMRARSRLATRRDAEGSGRTDRTERHQKFREAYLHFNKRYYWMSRCGTTCSVVSPFPFCPLSLSPPDVHSLYIVQIRNTEREKARI